LSIQSLKNLSVSKKILYVFFLASFIPILCLTYFSSSYVSKIIEKETQDSLLKQVQSYGLFTFEALRSFSEKLDDISLITKDKIPENIVSPFNKIELLPIEDVRIHGITYKHISALNFHLDDNNNLSFQLKKIHYHNNNDYVLRAEFILDSLSNNHNGNPFNGPLCIFSNSGIKLYCNDETIINNLTSEDIYNC